jgi:hypothetical protein
MPHPAATAAAIASVTISAPVQTILALFFCISISFCDDGNVKRRRRTSSLNID